jgi:hypothetical protein
MKKSYSFTKCLGMIGVCWLGLTMQSAQAQSFDPTSLITAINAIRASLDGIVNTTATYIFQTPPNIGNELVTNNTQSTAIQTVLPGVNTLSNQDIVNALVPDVTNPNAALTQLASVQASDTILQSTVASGVPMPFYSSAAQNSMQNALAQGNENLNFTSLITPLAYNTPALQNLALNYLRFVSGYANPVSNFSLNSYPESQLSTKQKLTFQNTPTYQQFMVQRRNVVAQQSILLSNLYYIYSRRLPIPTIHASDTALGVATPSAAQIEDYVATWRTASPTWYTQMATVAPSNVARESLYVLAEMQTELHRMHQDNERIIALLATSQMPNLANNKTALLLVEKSIKDQLDQMIKQNSKAGTTQTQAQTPQSQNAQQQGEAQKLLQRQNQVKQAEGQNTNTQQQGNTTGQ